MGMLRLYPVFLILIFFTTNLSYSNNNGNKKPEIWNSINKLPLVFTLNNGRFDPEVRFSARNRHVSFFFTSTGTTFLFEKGNNENINKTGNGLVSKYNYKRISTGFKNSTKEYFAVKMNFIKSNPRPKIMGEERLPWNNNYFYTGNPQNWNTGVPNYSKIRIKNLFNSIDLIYYGKNSGLKYDFIIKPGGDPSDIILEYNFDKMGDDIFFIDDSGDLIIKTPLGEIVEKKPYCYQKIKDCITDVKAEYKIIDRKKGQFTYSIAGYNPDYPLIIDPEITYSTLLGGNYDDVPYGMTVDDDGYIYVTGRTSSTDFPTNAGSYDYTLNAFKGTAFISKFDPTCSTLIFSTYLGGDVEELPFGIAVDRDKNVYITGFTESDNFPTTSGVFAENYSGGSLDAFVTKLNPDGSGLIYSTYIGGELGGDAATDISLCENGEVYIVGDTDSGDYPTTSGAYDETYNGWDDLFLTKLSADGSELLVSTYIGGQGDDKIGYIERDSGGNIYISGQTMSGNLPVTPNAFDKSYSGEYTDALICKLDPDGKEMLYLTYLGGSGKDEIRGMAIDGERNIYISGRTESENFPVTPGSYDQHYSAGGGDAFVCKLNASGSGLEFSTFLGGINYDAGWDITVDSSGNIFTTGQTFSTSFSPLIVEPYITNSAGYPEQHVFRNKAADAENGLFSSLQIFICRLSSDGKTLYETFFLGGSRSDWSNTILTDNRGRVYITGMTYSDDYPTTENAYSSTYGGGEVDAFITVISFDLSVNIINKLSDNSPDQLRLHQNYPNPFNISTIIEYEILKSTHTEINIYSSAGQLVKMLVSENITPGTYNSIWDGTDNNGQIVNSGIYFCRLKTSRHSVVTKMILIK